VEGVCVCEGYPRHTPVPTHCRNTWTNMCARIMKHTHTRIYTQRAPFNPIRQDLTDDGDLRFLSSPIDANYGMLPQTWEDPEPGAASGTPVRASVGVVLEGASAGTGLPKG